MSDDTSKGGRLTAARGQLLRASRTTVGDWVRPAQTRGSSSGAIRPACGSTVSMDTRCRWSPPWPRTPALWHRPAHLGDRPGLTLPRRYCSTQQQRRTAHPPPSRYVCSKRTAEPDTSTRSTAGGRRDEAAGQPSHLIHYSWSTSANSRGRPAEPSACGAPMDGRSTALLRRESRCGAAAAAGGRRSGCSVAWHLDRGNANWRGATGRHRLDEVGGRPTGDVARQRCKRTALEHDRPFAATWRGFVLTSPARLASP